MIDRLSGSKIVQSVPYMANHRIKKAMIYSLIPRFILSMIFSNMRFLIIADNG
jgi:hypothetical protein